MGAAFLATALELDELLCEVRFPISSPWATSVVQEVARRYGDYALVGLAAVIEQSGAGVVEYAALSYFVAAGCRVSAPFSTRKSCTTRKPAFSRQRSLTI